jgi:hypothetical protein
VFVIGTRKVSFKPTTDAAEERREEVATKADNVNMA